MATTINITIDQGSEFRHVFQLANSSLISFTNATPYASMKSEYDSPCNAVPFTASIGGSNVTISMPSTQTSNLHSGTWVYDVILVDPSNNVVRVVQGRVTVDPEVTTFPPA